MGEDDLPVIRSKSGSSQLNFFQILDPNDRDYSQAIELYDAMPKFSHDKRQKDFTETNTDVSRTFVVRNREYEIRIFGAILERADKSKYIAFPGRREETVEDALRKLTVSNGNAFVERDALWCEFSLHELQKELADNNHSFSKTELKEALEICHQTRISVNTVDGKKITSGYMLPHLTLISAEDLKKDRNARCLVRFNDMVSTSITELTFRQYNYRISQSFRHSLARSLFKRMSYNWRQARGGLPYGPIFLTTVFRDSGRDINPKMAQNRRIMVQALNELIEKNVIVQFEYVDNKLGRKINDISYTLHPHPSFIRDQKRANHFETQTSNAKLNLK